MLGTEMMAFVTERMVTERIKVLKICKPSATTPGLRSLRKDLARCLAGKRRV
jgi:hypothetical protein